MAQPLPWQTKISRKAYVEHLRAVRATDAALAKALRDAAISGERLVRQTLSSPSNVSQAVRRAQYQSSIVAIRQAQAGLWSEVTRATREGIIRASAAAADGQLVLLDVLMTSASREKLGGKAAANLLLQSMNAAAMAAAEDVRSRLINNIPLSDQVYKTRALSQKQVDKVVNRGIALQKSAAEIAKDVRVLIRPDTPGGVSYAAKRLARTEINNAFHATEIRMGNELPWIEAYKWELSGSHPIPDECDDFAEDDSDNLGAGIWSKENVPAKPHPNCLCYLTTVTASPSEFNSKLLAGGYDSWLRDKGLVGIRKSA